MVPFPPRPVGAALQQHEAFAFEHEPLVMCDAPVLEPDDSGVGPVGRGGVEHFAEGVERVAVVDGRPEPQAVAAELGQGLLGHVLAGQAEDDRRRDEPEHHPARAERAISQEVLVPVRLGGVHDLLADEVVLDLADRGGPGMAHALPGGEVLEVPGRAGQ